MNRRLIAYKSNDRTLCNMASYCYSEGIFFTLMSSKRTTSPLKTWITSMDVLRVRVRYRLLSSKTGKHDIHLLPGSIKRLKNNSFTVLSRATYFTSVGERAKYFCVLETQLTQAPPHKITPRETDLLSVALLAKSASAKAFREILAYVPLWQNSSLRSMRVIKRCFGKWHSL